jgi:hypothetical protein
MRAILREVKENGAELMIASVRGRALAAGEAPPAKARAPSPRAQPPHHATCPPCPAHPTPPPRHPPQNPPPQHNQESIELAVAEMQRLGLPPSGGGVYFGQLLGMAGAPRGRVGGGRGGGQNRDCLRGPLLPALLLTPPHPSSAPRAARQTR